MGMRSGSAIMIINCLVRLVCGENRWVNLVCDLRGIVAWDSMCRQTSSGARAPAASRGSAPRASTGGSGVTSVCDSGARPLHLAARLGQQLRCVLQRHPRRNGLHRVWQSEQLGAAAPQPSIHESLYGGARALEQVRRRKEAGEEEEEEGGGEEELGFELRAQS